MGEKKEARGNKQLTSIPAYRRYLLSLMHLAHRFFGHREMVRMKIHEKRLQILIYHRQKISVFY
jgi:hypothetical protein